MAGFRFGVNMTMPSSRASWVDKCRAAEELGYSTVAVPDHLGMPSPFPALVLAAEATSRVRLGTLVVNSAFYNPTMLARDVVGVDMFTDGRLELGLGAGYGRAEFDKAGIPFGTPAQRIHHLGRVLDELDRFCADPDEPDPVQRPVPPVMIAGAGDRLLTLAARRAGVVGFVGMDFDGQGRPRFHDAERFADRVQLVTDALGARAGQVEFNVLVQRVVVTDNRAEALDRLAGEMARRTGHLTGDRLGEVPLFLVGSPEHIADQLRARRERYGIGYVTVLENDFRDFAKVIPLLA
jgi:probable F420-dependent oxidoreductase